MQSDPDFDDSEPDRTQPEATAPFCRIIPSGSVDEQRIEVVLPDGRGGTVSGVLTAGQARGITLGLRSCAAEVDEQPFFAGGWSKAEVLRAIAHDYTRLKEGDGSEL